MGSDANKGSLSPTDPAHPEIPESAQAGKMNVAKHALQMAAGTMSSRVLGLVREVAFAALFDRAVTDAWLAAFKLPNLFRRLLGEGSLSVSFVPVFVEARLLDGSGARSRELLNSFFTLLLILLSGLTVLGVVFAEPVLRVLLDPVYVAQAEKFAMTVRMAKIMFGFVFLISSYAFFMAVLNALGRFALAAMAPVLFNVAMITATLLPSGWFPEPGDGLAWGVIAGGFLQAAVLLPSLRRLGVWPRISWNFGNEDVKRVLRNMVPGLIGLGLLQITTLVNMRFASELGEGPISWIAWADRLLELPLSLVSVSLGTALLPTLAGHWTQGEKDKMSDTLNFYLRLNFFVCLGAAIGLFYLAGPIIEILFQRGRFSEADTVATANVLKIWALIMLPVSGVRVLAPGYYAVKNTWYPAVVSAFCLAAHIVAAPQLMALWGLRGLNLSALMTACLNFVFLLVAYRWLVTSFSYARLALQMAKFAVPAVAMMAGLQVYDVLRETAGDSFTAKALSLTITILFGGLAYALASRLMRLEEFDQTATRLAGRLLRKFR